MEPYFVKNRGLEDFLTSFSPFFEQFLQLEKEQKLLDNQLKIIFGKLLMNEFLQTKKDVNTIITALGFEAAEMSNGELVNIVKEVLNENPAIVEQYKGGKETTIGFFVGQVMKKT
jgi:aspartyl-tRNA(Asn)/glutamyl-tRNA(Gln) amidotransferase subunit B